MILETFLALVALAIFYPNPWLMISAGLAVVALVLAFVAYFTEAYQFYTAIFVLNVSPAKVI